MFGKVMSIPDHLMRNYFELLTRRSPAEIVELLNADATHPRDAKVTLAKEIVAQFHSADAAENVAEEFFRIHGGGQSGLPDEIPELAVPSSVSAADLVMLAGFAQSKSEARRLIHEKGVRLDGRPLSDPLAQLDIRRGVVLQRGKRKFLRLTITD